MNNNNLALAGTAMLCILIIVGGLRTDYLRSEADRPAAEAYARHYMDSVERDIAKVIDSVERDQRNYRERSDGSLEFLPTTPDADYWPPDRIQNVQWWDSLHGSGDTTSLSHKIYDPR